MTKIRKILKRAGRGKHSTSKQTRSANSMSVLVFRTTHTIYLFCQANSKAPKVEQVFPYATCNNHSFVAFFVYWSIMKLMLQFGKVQLLIRSIEYSSQGVWVAEIPPTKRVDEFPPCYPMCLAQRKRLQNHFDVITISIIWRTIIDRKRKNWRKQWL